MEYKYIISFSLVIIVLVSGCINFINREDNESVVNDSVSESTLESIRNLLSYLNYSVNNYNASYYIERNFSSWSGNPGSMDYKVKSKVFVLISNGSVINYTMKYCKKGWPIEDEIYYVYYDRNKNKICKENLITRSECEPVQLIPPKMGRILNGCRVSFSPDGRDACECNGTLEPIDELLGFACSEKKNTYNMKLENGVLMYYPEKKEGFCYFIATDRDTGEFWAFECEQNDMELKPLVTNNVTPMTNVKCYDYTNFYTNFCDCFFDPVWVLNCSNGTPMDFNTKIKHDIKEYLNNIRVASIVEKDDKNGHCFTFFFNNLEHIFCFDKRKIITFAQWGSNIREMRRTRIDINRIKLINWSDYDIDCEPSRLQ